MRIIFFCYCLFLISCATSDNELELIDNNCVEPSRIVYTESAIGVSFDFRLAKYEELIIEYKLSNDSLWLASVVDTLYGEKVVPYLQLGVYDFRLVFICNSKTFYVSEVVTIDYNIGSIGNGDNNNGSGNNGDNGGGNGCPTTANCGCSNIKKADCPSSCCKWIVGTGCKCR